MSCAAAGVASTRRIASANSQPSNAIRTDPTPTSPIAEPSARRAPSMSRRPIDWPTRMVAAMPNPNTALKVRNMMMLALLVAASAPSPRKRPTQIELIEPFSDWRMFEPSVGSANRISVRPIGPLIRSRWPRADDARGESLSLKMPHRRAGSLPSLPQQYGNKLGIRAPTGVPESGRCAHGGHTTAYPTLAPCRTAVIPTAPAPPSAAPPPPRVRRGRRAPFPPLRAWRVRRSWGC